MFEGATRGLSVLEGSVGMFVERPRLLLLPLASLLLVGGGFAIVGGLAFHLGLLGPLVSNDLLRYAAVFVVLAISSGLGTFFNAAVAYCAAGSFEGETPTLREGLAAAWRVRRGILAWSIVAATVGTVMYVIDEKFGAIGSLARLGFDLAWSVLTFFVIPIIVLEREESVRPMLERSGHLFTERWSETITLTLGLGALAFLLLLPTVAVLGTAFVLSSGPMQFLVVVLGAFFFGALLVAMQTIGTIARTALYVYAADGERVGPFADLHPATMVDD